MMWKNKQYGGSLRADTIARARTMHCSSLCARKQHWSKASLTTAMCDVVLIRSPQSNEKDIDAA